MTGAARGRPRDSERHDAILDATRDLLATSSYAALSMESVAARAGVGKKTLYRRWPSKAPLVAEAVLDAYGGNGSFPVPDTGDVAADLRGWLAEHVAFISTPENAAMIRGLIAAAAANPTDQEELFGRLSAPQHDGLVVRLRAAVAEGQLRRGVSVDAIADALVGALLLAVLTRSDRSTRRTSFDGLVEALLYGSAQ